QDALRGSSAACKLWSVFRVAHFPAERRDPLAQFIAAFPILIASCVLALLCELRYFVGNGDVSLSFKIKNGVDSFPPFQPRSCRTGVHPRLIHGAIGFTNGFE